MVRGSGFILGGGGWWWVYLGDGGWWWVMVYIFWAVVDGGGYNLGGGWYF